MKNRMLTLVTAILVLSFAGSALATERGAEAAAGTTVQAGDISVVKHVNDQGEAVLCIAERDFSKLLKFYEQAQEQAEKQANQRRELEAAFEDIAIDW